MANKRLELAIKLEDFCPNCYYQPPSDITMKYPCIIYNKDTPLQSNANDFNYISIDKYILTIVEYKADTGVAEKIRDAFRTARISQKYIADRLHHTKIELYF